MKSNKVLLATVIVGFILISVIVFLWVSGVVYNIFLDSNTHELLKQYENEGYTVLLYKETENRIYGNGTLKVVVRRNINGKSDGKTYLEVKLSEFDKKTIDLKWTDNGAILEIKDTDSLSYADYPILWENVFDNEENQSRNNLSERSESYG